MALDHFGSKQAAEAEGEASDVVRRRLAELDLLDPQPDDPNEWLAKALSSSRMLGTGRVREGVQVGRPEALALGDFQPVVVLGVSDEDDGRHPEAHTIRTAALILLAQSPEVTLTISRVQCPVAARGVPPSRGVAGPHPFEYRASGGCGRARFPT